MESQSSAITSMKIAAMRSEEFKERFKAEYYQLAVRYHNLMEMYENWDNLGFTLDCPKSVIAKQLNAMLTYKDVLDERARYEGVSLDEIL